MARVIDPSDVPFTAAPRTSPADATLFTCALCGQRFTHGGLACGQCPLGRGCDSVSCPRCGHAFPRSSRLIEGLQRLFGRRRQHPA